MNDILIERLFAPCTVCGEETRYLEMYLCIQCDEPICKECYRQDGFCSDECYDNYSDDVNGDEDWEDNLEWGAMPPPWI